MTQDEGSVSRNDPRPPNAQHFNESIRGRKVIAADGQVIGEITDLAVDTGTWRVHSLRLKLDKAVADALAVHRGRFHAATIDLPVQIVQSVGDTIVLSVPTSSLRPTVTSPTDAAA
jgi:sporulation protein YlmC with PRC-barrel domain